MPQNIAITWKEEKTEEANFKVALKLPLLLPEWKSNVFSLKVSQRSSLGFKQAEHNYFRHLFLKNIKEKIKKMLFCSNRVINVLLVMIWK